MEALSEDAGSARGGVPGREEVQRGEGRVGRWVLCKTLSPSRGPVTPAPPGSPSLRGWARRHTHTHTPPTGAATPARPERGPRGRAEDGGQRPCRRQRGGHPAADRGRRAGPGVRALRRRRRRPGGLRLPGRLLPRPPRLQVSAAAAGGTRARGRPSPSAPLLAQDQALVQQLGVASSQEEKEKERRPPEKPVRGRRAGAGGRGRRGPRGAGPRQQGAAPKLLCEPRPVPAPFLIPRPSI